MSNEVSPPNQIDVDSFHRNHPFTMPTAGDRIVSPLTGAMYFIGDELNRGNFGVVFDCGDEWGHSLVAKVIKPFGDFVQTEALAMSEITAAALVRSPHVVHVHDAFIHRGACYMIYERCNMSLREMIAGPTACNPRTWFPPLAKAILHALHFMHVQGLAHCDVHAGNVFLRFIPDAILPADQSACMFQLGDFGQARPIQAIDPRGTFLNSLRPPEAINPSEFGRLDQRGDIYQAGLLFLGFLTGEELRLDPEDICSGRPRQMAEMLPMPIGSVIAKMLRRHSASRQETALDSWREMAQALLKMQ